MQVLIMLNTKMNILNGIFYKRKIFQVKYHWVEIKYLGAIKNRRRQLFCRCDNAISYYTPAFTLAIAACRRELERLYIFKYVYKYLKYSDLNSIMQNA